MSEESNSLDAFRNLSSFVGSMLRSGAIENASAQEMLVQGFWEIEAESAFDEEGEDLLGFAQAYCRERGLVAVES
ncbi:MAG: hypothetical protein KDB07_00530 [Planctomycetes bacterium]|nr:hypothetical protein [Planctomycetota bacterium]